MRWTTVVLGLVLASAACRSGRVVTLGWDVPKTPPDGYWVLVDDRTVMDIPPPPVDPTCSCLSAKVRVPTGKHTVKVVAYMRNGGSSPSATVVVE